MNARKQCASSFSPNSAIALARESRSDYHAPVFVTTRVCPDRSARTALTPLNKGGSLLASSIFRRKGVLMSHRLLAAFALAVVALFFFPAGQALAQLNTADILGTVTDAGGAVVPGVKVTAINTSTNDVKTATTSTG